MSSAGTQTSHHVISSTWRHLPGITGTVGKSDTMAWLVVAPPGSSVERPRPADEQIAPNVEPQQPVGCARNADARALPEFIRRLTISAEPKRTSLTEVYPVQPAINRQGLTQASGPPRQVSNALGAAISLHDPDAMG